MFQRGKLRDGDFRNLPIRYVQWTLHIRLNDPVFISRTGESDLFRLRFPTPYRYQPLLAVQPEHSQGLNVPLVGIVGGVGAGKSSVVKAVAGLRLFVIDADQSGHELLLDNDILG